MQKDNNFRFDAETHTYMLGDERLPSVSEIISPLSDYSSVPPERLKNGAEYGQAVHKTIELWLKNDLDEEMLDEGLRRPLDAFVKWYELFSKQNGKPVDVEVPKYHEKLRYAGTPDIVFDEYIVDVKTRKFNRVTDTVQLIAYANLYPSFPHKKLIVLELSGDTLVLTNAENRSAWGIFRKLLDNYRSNQEIRTLIKNWKGEPVK